jgi:hypothetical protein
MSEKKLTKLDIESFGFEFIIRDNELEEFTFRKDSENKGYYYALVWREDLQRIVICYHDLKKDMFGKNFCTDIERIFYGKVKCSKTLKSVLELVIPIIPFTK